MPQGLQRRPGTCRCEAIRPSVRFWQALCIKIYNADGNNSVTHCNCGKTLQKTTEALRLSEWQWPDLINNNAAILVTAEQIDRRLIHPEAGTRRTLSNRGATTMPAAQEVETTIEKSDLKVVFRNEGGGRHDLMVLRFEEIKVGLSNLRAGSWNCHKNP